MKKQVWLCALLAVGGHLALAQTPTNTFPTTGNAGIGTLSPGAKLEIAGYKEGAPSLVKYIRLNDVSEAWDADGYMRQVWDVNIINHYFDPFFDSPGLDFRTGYVQNPSSNNPALPSTLNSVLKLTADGLVGIGEPKPLSKLHVNGNIRINALVGGSTRMVTVGSSGELSTQALPTLSVSGNNLTIAGGNTVTLPSGSTPTLSFSGTTLSITGGSSVNLSSLKDNLGNHTATNTLSMATFSIQNTGNISFANGASFYGSSPNFNGIHTLHNFGVAGSASGTYELDVEAGSGVIRCYDVIETSDARFKSNVKAINRPLEVIQRLEGVGYTFQKGDNPARADYGFIAQEIRKVIPEIVSEDENGILGLNYSGIIPFLVQGVKEQQSIIEQQNLRIEKLEETVEKLLAASPVRPATGEEPILFQNTPNPFDGLTQIKCMLPKGTVSAQINLYNISGVQINSIRLAGDGEQTVTVDAKDLATNIYVYSLLVDGKLVDSKRMIVNK